MHQLATIWGKLWLVYIHFDTLHPGIAKYKKYKGLGVTILILFFNCIPITITAPGYDIATVVYTNNQYTIGNLVGQHSPKAVHFLKKA